MSHRDFPLAEDENTILITAEFIEDGKKLKTAQRGPQLFELELIVSDDTTLAALLEAVGGGLRRRLLDLYGIDTEQISRNEAYDELYMLYGQENEDSPKLRRWAKRPLRPAQHAAPAQKETGRTVRGMSAAPDKPQDELQQWLICWNVYQECLKHYRQGAPQASHEGTFKKLWRGKPKITPVVACGTVDLRMWPKNAPGKETPQVQLVLEMERDSGKTLHELGFLTGSRLIFDCAGYHSADVLIDRQQIIIPSREEYPDYKSGIRHPILSSTSDFHIKAPNLPPDRRSSIAAAALAGVPGLILLWVIWNLLESLQTESVWNWLILGGFTAICSILTVWLYRRTSDLSMRRWAREYESYIRHCIDKVQKMQEKDKQLLRECYLPACDLNGGTALTAQACAVSGEIYSRKPGHNDFLWVRLGLSEKGSRIVPSLFQIHGSQEQAAFSAVRYANIRGHADKRFRVLLSGDSCPEGYGYDGTSGYLSELPNDLANQFGYLENTPVMLDLQKNRSIGVLYQDNSSFRPLLLHMLMDLSFHHAPEDVQFILFCPQIKNLQAQQDYIRPFKHLPHFHMLLKDRSAFVFGKEQAKCVLDRLYRDCSQDRGGSPKEGGRHVILFVQEDYGLRRHPLWEMLPKAENEMVREHNHLTFVFFTRFSSTLPTYCSMVIKRTAEGKWFRIPYQIEYQRTTTQQDLREEHCFAYQPDPQMGVQSSFSGQALERQITRGMRVLSAIHHGYMHRSALPGECDYFQMLVQRCAERGMTGFAQKDPNHLLQNYIRSVRKDQMVALEIPLGIGAAGTEGVDLSAGHMLVIGDAGTGKTETLLTLAFSLCTHYSQEKIKLMLLDVHNNEILPRLGHQPHVLEAKALSLSGVTAWYQVMERIRCEQNDRMIKFDRLKVHDIRAFNKKCVELGQIQEILPDWVVIVDHLEKYGRYLNQSSEQLQQELALLMQSLTPCGIHLVLSWNTQEGMVTQELLDQAELRLCMQLCDESRSQQVIASPAAALPPLPPVGRAWVYNTRTADRRILQIALCTTKRFKGEHPRTRVTYMDHAGSYELFFDSQMRKEKQPSPGATPEDDSAAVHIPPKPEQKPPRKTIPSAETLVIPREPETKPPKTEDGQSTPGTAVHKHRPDRVDPSAVLESDWDLIKDR